MFLRLKNYKLFIFLLAIFVFYLGMDNFNLDITQQQLVNDLISNVESNSNLDPVIEDPVIEDPVIEDSKNHKKFIYIACGVFVVSLLIVGFFYYKGGDSGSSLSLGKDDFTDPAGVVASQYSDSEYFEGELPNVAAFSGEVNRLSEQVSDTNANEATISMLNEFRDDILPALENMVEGAREADLVTPIGTLLFGLLTNSGLEVATSATQIITEMSPGPAPINGWIGQEVRHFLSNFPVEMYDIILTRAQYYYTNFFLGLCLPGIAEVLYTRFVIQHPGFLRFLTWPVEDVLEDVLSISHTWLLNIINNSTGGIFFSDNTNREHCTMIMAYLGGIAGILIFNFKIYLDILLQGGFDVVASIIIDFSVWEEVILPGMTLEEIKSVLGTIRTIFITYEDMVVLRGFDINTYRIFLNVESEDVLNKMIKLRDTVVSRVGSSSQNIRVNNMYLFVTILSDIMRELIKFR